MQWGGEDQVFSSEVNILRNAGHEVLEYTDTNLRINNLNAVSIVAQTLWSEHTRKQLIKLLKKFKPDVAHFHNTFLLISPSAYYACKEMEVPVIQTLHNYRLLCPAAIFFRDGHICTDCFGKNLAWPGIFHSCFYRSRIKTAVVAGMLALHRLLRTWDKQIDIYIAPSEFSRQKFIEFGFSKEKILTKPNFIHTDSDIKKEKGYYALFVGRFSDEKGIKTLVKSWQHVDSIPLKIVGDGPLSAEVKIYTNSNNISNLEFLGNRTNDEVLSFMRSALFLIVPSECYEVLSLVCIEAFACGIPVIASRLGSLEEMVQENKTGLLFEPGNDKDLADKVSWAWGHPEELKRMGQEARKEYEAKYTAENNYSMLLGIYNKAIRNYNRK
jgi:glycosyltransferase involved in cell wall biosynthesis